MGTTRIQKGKVEKDGQNRDVLIHPEWEDIEARGIKLFLNRCTALLSIAWENSVVGA